MSQGLASVDAPSPLRSQSRLVGLLVIAGIAAGVAWRYLLPFFLDHSDQQESYFAVDGSLAAITAAAGLVTGLLVMVLPGRYPAVRSAAAIVGSIGAAAVAWATGYLLGTPVLQSTGVLLIWPVVTSIALFIGSMLPIVSDRFNPPVPARRPGPDHPDQM